MMQRAAGGLALLLVLLVCCTLQPVRGSGLIPKSRRELREEQQEREHRAKMLRRKALQEALAEQAAEEERKKEAAERARKWREERLRLYQQHQEKQKVIEAQKAQEQEAVEAAKAKEAKRHAKRLRQIEAERKAYEENGRRPLSPNRFGGNAGIGKPIDCFGIPGGPARKDACEVCAGDNSTCSDCAGTPHGTKKEDCSGVCGGDDMSCVDCAGVFNGNSVYDQCGLCGGDGTTCLDCLGQPNGTAHPDACGICNGDGSSCADCHGVPNGPGKMGPCGICDGDGTTCCSPARGTGDRMPDGLDPTTPPVLCSAHGTCSPDHRFCLCDRGWTGPFCSVRQNLCLAHQAESGEDPCNGRGSCDPETGLCACHQPENWVGPRCEFSRCSRRGAYNLKAGRCTCQHGYGGRYCERCADHRPKPGYLHVCMERPRAWQPVPEHLKLEKSILLGEEHPKAPVFFLLDQEEEIAKSEVTGLSFMNWVTTKPGGKLHRRDVIWPNSTHAASGYYYDCACRLAAPPPADDDDDKDDDHARGISPALPYRPRFGPASKVDRKEAAEALKARNHGISERAPATLSECQDLLEDVLDEFGYSIDVSTAEVSTVAAAVAQVNDSCAGEATFGIAWFLIAMLVAIAIALLTVLCWWCTRSYITIRSPFEEL